MAICKPRLIASPEAAEPPDTAAATPSLIGGGWAPGTPASVARAASVSSVASARFIDEPPWAAPCLDRGQRPGVRARMLYADFVEEARDLGLHLGAVRAIGKVAAA